MYQSYYVTYEIQPVFLILCAIGLVLLAGLFFNSANRSSYSPPSDDFEEEIERNRADTARLNEDRQRYEAMKAEVEELRRQIGRQ